MRLLPIALGVACAATVPSLLAQQARRDTGQRISAHTLLGVRLPTGRQRDLAGSAVLIGGQVAVRLGGHTVGIGSISAAQGDDRSHASDNSLTAVQYDIGVERHACPFCEGATPVTTFVGAGVGGRTYWHDRGSRPATSSPAAYAASGLELRRGRAGFRFELRDYIVGLQPDGQRSTWNEIALLAGLAYHFH